MPLTGQWRECGITLQSLSNNVSKKMNEAIKEQGEMIKEVMVGHIDNQDLGWTPLSSDTIRIKGTDIIYVESGELKSELLVRGIKSSVNQSTVFVGANPWTSHKGSGMKSSDLLAKLEYGTSKMPPRPLIRPTWEEVKPIVEKNLKACLGDIRKMR